MLEDLRTANPYVVQTNPVQGMWQRRVYTNVGINVTYNYRSREEPSMGQLIPIVMPARDNAGRMQITWTGMDTINMRGNVTVAGEVLEREKDHPVLPIRYPIINTKEHCIRT